MRTVKSNQPPQLNKKNLTSISKTCIKTVNEIVSDMVEAEKTLQSTSQETR